MEIVQRGAPRSVFKIKTTPAELRNAADQMEAAANGSTLPGQVVAVPFRNLFDFEWDPEITADKFARGLSAKREITYPVPAVEDLQQQAPGLTQ